MTALPSSVGPQMVKFRFVFCGKQCGGKSCDKKSSGRFASRDRAILHGPAAVSFQQRVEAVNKVDLLAIKQFCHVPHAGASDPFLTDFPGACDLLRPIGLLANLQPRGSDPACVVRGSGQRWTNESMTDLFDLLAMLGHAVVLPLKPHSDRQSPAGPQPVRRSLEEARLVEQVFGAFNAPNHIKLSGIKLSLIGIEREKLGALANAMPLCGHRGPATLDGAERNPGGSATAALGQPNRRASQA